MAEALTERVQDSRDHRPIIQKELKNAKTAKKVLEESLTKVTDDRFAATLKRAREEEAKVKEPVTSGDEQSSEDLVNADLDLDEEYEIKEEDLREALSYVRNLFKYLKKASMKLPQFKS